jgi:hypothetical protein
MFNNITNFFNLITNRKIKTASTIEDTDLIPLGTKDPTYLGGYQPTAITYQELVASIPLPVGGVQSVTGGTANSIVQVNNTDPSNPIIQINGVKYSNVLFVDAINPSGTPAPNRFDLPFDIGGALVTANTLTPTATNRTLVYVRRGEYSNVAIVLKNYTDWYCEAGVVFVNTVVYDNVQTVDSRFLGKASFTGTGFNNWILRLQGASTKAVFEFDEINCTRGAFETGNGASAVISGRKVYSESTVVAAGSTFRGSGNVTLNISEEFKAVHQTILFKSLSGKVVVNCPKLAIGTGNYFGGNFKQIIQCAENNAGGTCTINGNLVNEDAGGFLGGISGIIGRWLSDNMTLIVNGDIIGGDNLAVRAQGSSADSKTIINGSATSTLQVGFISGTSSVVFRDGTLINYNTSVGAANYPILIANSTSKLWIENCHLYSAGSGEAAIGALWMQTTTAVVSINNSVHSGADSLGFFIINAIGGQPLTNVRIHNCRSTKPLDVNIVDLLSPTGFIQDPNIIAINFI